MFTVNSNLIDKNNSGIPGLFFELEITANPSNKVRIIKSEKDLRIFVKNENQYFLISYYMINGLPKQKKMLSESFFQNCYVKVLKFSQFEYKVYFLQRIKGGGNVSSTDRQGAQITRSTQKVSGWLTGESRTQQEIQDEIKEIFEKVNGKCAKCIREVAKFKPIEDQKVGELSRLNEEMESAYKEKNIELILTNIDGRIYLFKSRGDVIRRYCESIHVVIDKISNKILKIEKNMRTIDSKKEEIEKIQSNQYLASLIVDKFAVFLDGAILDPFLGCKEGTSVWHFLQGYDCMGRPPANLDEVDSWVASAKKLKRDLLQKRNELGTSITHYEKNIYELQRYRLEISKKKFEILIKKSSDLRSIIEQCKDISFKAQEIQYEAEPLNKRIKIN